MPGPAGGSRAAEVEEVEETAALGLAAPALARGGSAEVICV